MRFYRLTRPLLLVFVVCLSLPTKAQPLIDQVPAESVLYVGWRGTQDMGPGYAGSNLQGVIEQAGMDGAMSQLFAAIQQFAQAQDLPPEAAEMMGMGGTLWTELWDNGGCFYMLAPVPGGPPMPRASIVWNQSKGQETGELTAAIDKLATLLKEEGQLPITTGEVAGGLFLSFNFDPNGQAMQPLKAAAAFQKASAQVDRDGALTLYMDVEAWVSEIGKLIEQMAPDEEAADVWTKLRGSSGLSGLKRVVLSSGLKEGDKNWHTQMYIEAPSPRVGLLSLFDSKPVAAKSLSHVPKTATHLSVMTLDTGKVLDIVRGMISSVEPEAVAEMDQAIKDASANLGFDIEQNLLKGMGPVWSMYIDPMVAGNGYSSMVLVNELNDPKGVEQALTSLTGMGNGLAQMTQEMGFYVRLQNKSYKDATITYLGVPLVSPSFMVHKGRLYFAMFPQALEMAVDQSGEHEDSIWANPSFAKKVTELKAKAYTGLTFTDLPETAAEGYGVNLMVLQTLSGVSEMLGGQPSTVSMPPLGKLMPFVQPSGSVMWADAQGIHLTGAEPFPGSTALGPLGGGGSGMNIIGAIIGVVGEEMN